jgi:hypothetical protein
MRRECRASSGIWGGQTFIRPSNKRHATQRNEQRAGGVREGIRSRLASDVLVGKAGGQEYYFTLFAEAPTRTNPRGT